MQYGMVEYELGVNVDMQSWSNPWLEPPALARTLAVPAVSDHLQPIQKHDSSGRLAFLGQGLQAGVELEARLRTKRRSTGGHICC